LQIYLERCLFRLLQALSSTISRSQILHRRPFEGLRPDFLICTNLHGMLYNSATIISFVGLLAETTSTYKFCQKWIFSGVFVVTTVCAERFLG